MPPPKFSVVIPLYNKEASVSRAIDSVLRQSFRDFEIVVVDDGSTDGGAAVVARFADDRIRLIRKPNGGVSSARNRGVAESRGQVIAFLDADDAWRPDFLEVIAGLAARHPSAGAYGTSFEIVEPDGRRRVSRVAALRGREDGDVLVADYFEQALSGFVLWSSAAAVPKTTFEDVGGFPLGVSLGEDLDMWLRIGARYPVAVSGYVGSVYHKDAGNRADAARKKGYELPHVRTGLRLLESEAVEPGIRANMREYLFYSQIQTAAELVLCGRRREAIDMLRTCRTRRFLPLKLWWRMWAAVPTSAALAAQRIKRRLVGVS